MKKLLFLLLIVTGFKSEAQHYYSLSAVNNYLSQGFTLSRNFPLHKSLDADVGLFCTINIHSLRVNDEDYVFYKNGYAFNFWQHWGLQTRLNWKLFRIWKMNAYLSHNFLVTTYGLRAKYTGVPTFDTSGVHPTSFTEATKGSLALETTIGLQFRVPVNARSRLQVGAGVGVLLSNHSHYFLREEENVMGHSHFLGGMAPNWKRGMIEFIGIDGWPHVYVTYAHDLGSFRKKK